MKRLASNWSRCSLVLLCACSAFPALAQGPAGKVVPDESTPALQQPGMAADGTFRFQLLGRPGDTVIIQTSSDLVSWTSMNAVSITNVPMEIDDPDARTVSSRFYRVIPADSTNAPVAEAVNQIFASSAKQGLKDAQRNAAALATSAPIFNPLNGSPSGTDAILPRVSYNGLMLTVSRKQVLIARLSQIRIPEFSVRNKPLSEVLISLSHESRRLDPDRHGVNFVIDRSTMERPRKYARMPADPTARLPIPPDPGDVLITVGSLKNAMLGTVLDEIAKGAAVPMQYSILDYAAVFSLEQRDYRNPPLTH